MAKATNTVKDENTEVKIETSAEQKTIENTPVIETAKECSTTPASSVSNEEIFRMMQQMQGELTRLTSEKKELEDKLFYINLNNVNTNNKDKDISIIFNMYGRLDIELPDLNLVMTEFGEERDVTPTQFQTLIGKYRRFFKEEILLLNSRHMDLAEKYHVTTYDPNSKVFLHSKDLNKLGDMGIYELEDYYKDLSDNSKVGFLNYWCAKCYAKDPKYYDVMKMEHIDRITNSLTFQLLIKEAKQAQDLNK